MLETLALLAIVVALIAVAVWSARGGSQGRGEQARENRDAHYGGGGNF